MNKKIRLISLLFLLFMVACKPEAPREETSYYKYIGKTMGTYYRVTCDNVPSITKANIDSLLVDINRSLSTYDEHSIISQFNQLGTLSLDPSKPLDKYFIDVVISAREIYEASDHMFDPTVMPLVNYWGFGYKDRPRIKTVDTHKIDSLLKLVSFDKIKTIETDTSFLIISTTPGAELDFSAIAKGYGVDVVGDYLSASGVQNYLVDIGGELRARGVNPSGKSWSIGISKPLEDHSANETALLVQLQNVSLASSGNYRNFYESNGQKFSHTINPITGLTERSRLLGVSIIAKTTMEADALATACMVKGLEQSKEWVEKLNNVEACLIYNDADTLAMHLSSGFSRYLTLN